ncbi:MAG TPA: hypothetical protein VLQ48_12625, partial [Chloroflexia bacterium]|nr:hypothetical protein [Chloroflexia bacterium]
LRIEDGAWDIADDSTTDAELLPLGVVMKRMAITADGKDGWAIGNADDSTPIFWRYIGGKWATSPVELPDGATQPRSLTISADGTRGWMTVYEPDAQTYALLSLQDGAWADVPQVEGGQIEMAAVSADGTSGWALGRASAGAPLSIYALGNSKWTAGGSIDGATEATDLAADNTGNAWALVDGARVIRIHSGGAWEAAYTAESDVTLTALAVDNLERGWAVGWKDKGQVTQPGNIQYLRSPVLVRLSGDTATDVAPPDAAFAPTDVGVDAIALTPDGGQTWAGVRNKDGVGALSTFHEPFSYTNEGVPSPFPIEAPPLPPPMPGSGLCFAEVAYCLRGQFLAFWQTHGSIDQLGLPITAEMVEDLGGSAYIVQYTERARLEYHPENAGKAGEVLLGLLGNDIADSRQNENPFQPKPASASIAAQWFEATRHNLSPPFLEYWNANNGLDVFGYPRSEQFDEQNQADGKTYTVQYFERNRIEHHPENQGTKYEFQLGLLGVEQFKSLYGYTP